MSVFETVRLSIRTIEREVQNEDQASYRSGAWFALSTLIDDLRTHGALNADEYNELFTALNPDRGNWARFASEPAPELTVNGIRFELQGDNRYYSPSYPEFTFANEAEILAFINPPHAWPKKGVNIGDLIE